MDDIFYEKILYRILQGRLRLKLGDLVLYIHEPSLELLEESLDVYDDTYNKSYFSGVPIKSELIEVLVNNNMWTPHDDREADKIDKQIEELKLQALENHHIKRKLFAIKNNIRMMERKCAEYRSKKTQLDHTSCEGAATFARSVFLISNTAKTVDGQPYDWIKYTLSYVMDRYNDEQITHSTYRKIARSEPWRTMWLCGKTQSDLFGRPSYRITRDQAALVSFSSMYDNIYESHECPKDTIINDDDCLDGWMIKQRRESEKQKKQNEIDNLTKNPKIKNSDEIFVMATEKEDVDAIYGLNDTFSRNTINQRNKQIDNSDGNLDFRQLHDVKQDMQIQATQGGIQKVKGLQRSK